MIDPRLLRDDPDRVRASQGKRGLSADIVDRGIVRRVDEALEAGYTRLIAGGGDGTLRGEDEGRPPPTPCRSPRRRRRLPLHLRRPRRPRPGRERSLPLGRMLAGGTVAAGLVYLVTQQLRGEHQPELDYVEVVDLEPATVAVYDDVEYDDDATLTGGYAGGMPYREGGPEYSTTGYLGSDGEGFTDPDRGTGTGAVGTAGGDLAGTDYRAGTDHRGGTGAGAGFGAGTGLGGTGTGTGTGSGDGRGFTPDKGIRLAVTTKEAEVRVIGTGFTVMDASNIDNPDIAKYIYSE